MSKPTKKPTLVELDIGLRKLVKWTQFALHLPGIESTDIDIIKEDVSGVVEQKIALYNKWLKVYPDASWNDVVETLEKVNENMNAREIRDKYQLLSKSKCKTTETEVTTPSTPITSTTPPQSTTTTHEVGVSEDIVTELDTSHQRFLGLVRDVKTEVKERVKEDQLTVDTVANHLQEERAYFIPSLQSVQTTDDLFESIRPHYNFLNCYLIVSIAFHFLSGIVAEKATKYKEGIKKLMKTTEIRYFRNALKSYHILRKPSPNRVVVEIAVPDYWDQQNVWLVRKLVETLFPVKDPDELPWYDIVPGSIVMTFIALEHITSSLIESSMKKTKFMRLIGIIYLKVGNELVWQSKGEDKVLSFEDSLVRATLANEIEVVKFLLQYTNVDINMTNTNSALIIYDDDMFRESITDLLKSYYTIYKKLLKSVEYEIHQLIEAGTAGITDDTIASIRHPSSNFMNITAIVSIAHLLPEHISTRVKKYKEMFENGIIKRSALVSYGTYLYVYIPTEFPGSIEVIITLHNVWSTCSVWYVEQLGQLIFTPTLFYQLQWYRVDRQDYESVRVCLLADGKIVDSLKKLICGSNEMRTSILGVISVQIDDTVMVVNNYSDGYTFGEAIKLSKAIEDDEIFDLLQQMLLSPREYKEVSAVDKNNNLFFSPDPDSTPLMIACCNDNSQLVQLLLNHNADPNIHTRRDNTALIFSTGNSKTFQMLLDHGADVNIANFSHYTTLHFACWVGNFKVVKMILDQNSELVHAIGSNDRRPIDVACEFCRLEIIKQLLATKADPDVQDNEGYTPLLIASINGKTEIVDILLQANANPNLKDIEDQTPLHGASYNGHAEIVKKLILSKAKLNAQDDKGLTALHSASSRGHVETVKMLLQAKADPNIQDHERKTPLISATLSHHTNIVELLLTAENIDVDIQNNDGQTVLMVACAKSNIKVAELLLDAGAYAYLKNKDGKTALDLAIETRNKQFIEQFCSIFFD